MIEAEPLTLHIPKDADPGKVAGVLKKIFSTSYIGTIGELKGNYLYSNILLAGDQAIDTSSGKIVSVQALREAVREHCGFLRKAPFNISLSESILKSDGQVRMGNKS